MQVAEVLADLLSSRINIYQKEENFDTYCVFKSVE